MCRLFCKCGFHIVFAGDALANSHTTSADMLLNQTSQIPLFDPYKPHICSKSSFPRALAIAFIRTQVDIL